MTGKERLERIIQMQYDGYTIWDMSEDDLVWLIEQAERVQELEEEKERYQSGRNIAVKTKIRMDNLEKQNKRYREAIERALDESSWGDEGNALYRMIGILTKALEGEE